MAQIALIGAGGKMGCRITDNLKDSEHAMSYVEISEAGIKQLHDRGLSVTPQLEAVSSADVVILAVPDAAIGKVSRDVVPEMQVGSILMLLDPAAAYLEQLPKRSDVSYFAAHPCHPPVFNYTDPPENRRDFFGGVSAHQAIVCALIQGSDSDYATAEKIAVQMYAPVSRSHRITLEQMAILEPAMAETVGAAVATVLREALDEAVAHGVPFEAARDFMLGHINIELGIVFGEAGNPFSDAALVAIDYGRRQLLKGEWKRVFDSENIKEQINAMLNLEQIR